MLQVSWLVFSPGSSGALHSSQAYSPTSGGHDMLFIIGASVAVIFFSLGWLLGKLLIESICPAEKLNNLEKEAKQNVWTGRL